MPLPFYCLFPIWSSATLLSIVTVALPSPLTPETPLLLQLTRSVLGASIEVGAFLSCSAQNTNTRCRHVAAPKRLLWRKNWTILQTAIFTSMADISKRKTATRKGSAWILHDTSQTCAMQLWFYDQVCWLWIPAPCFSPVSPCPWPLSAGSRQFIRNDAISSAITMIASNQNCKWFENVRNCHSG